MPPRRTKKNYPAKQHKANTTTTTQSDNGRRLQYDRNAPDGQCRWCKAKVQPPRRTFCGDACVHEYLIRSNNKYMRDQVWKRDRGVCAGCGVSTSRIGKAVLAAQDAGDVDKATAVLAMYSIPHHRRIWRSKFRSAIFDVDHIQPVKTGGGQCGLDNLRTLCLPCHKAVTWAASAREKR